MIELNHGKHFCLSKLNKAKAKISLGWEYITDIIPLRKSYARVCIYVEVQIWEPNTSPKLASQLARQPVGSGDRLRHCNGGAAQRPRDHTGRLPSGRYLALTAISLPLIDLSSPFHASL